MLISEDDYKYHRITKRFIEDNGKYKTTYEIAENVNSSHWCVISFSESGSKCTVPFRDDKVYFGTEEAALNALMKQREYEAHFLINTTFTENE